MRTRSIEQSAEQRSHLWMKNIHAISRSASAHSRVITIYACMSCVYFNFTFHCVAFICLKSRIYCSYAQFYFKFGTFLCEQYIHWRFLGQKRHRRYTLPPPSPPPPPIKMEKAAATTAIGVPMWCRNTPRKQNTLSISYFSIRIKENYVR